MPVKHIRQPEDWDECRADDCPLGYHRQAISRVYLDGVLTLGARAVIARRERSTVVEITLPKELHRAG